METFFEGYSEKTLRCKWAMCEQYDIMNFSFRVGVNTENPSEIGLFYLYNGNLWKRIKSYSWSSIESTGNNFVPFLIKKDITDFLVKKYSSSLSEEEDLIFSALKNLEIKNYNKPKKKEYELRKKENDIYKEKILSILKDRDSAITISDAQNYLNVTQQRATAILKSMELNGIIYKYRTITGMIYYTLKY